nr:50S ribosomal protein L14, large subunit ribosomal protein L14 [uncultured archaeon]
MRALKSSINRSLPIGARVNCVDNSGAKIIQIISVKGYKTRTKLLMKAGVGDLVTAAVKTGKLDMRHKLVHAVIVRQKKEFTRPDGTKVKFEDNAAITLKDVQLGLPKGTMIKGPIAKEVATRWSAVAKTASMIL